MARATSSSCKSARWNDPAQINDVNDLSCRIGVGTPRRFTNRFARGLSLGSSRALISSLSSRRSIRAANATQHQNAANPAMLAAFHECPKNRNTTIIRRTHAAGSQTATNPACLAFSAQDRVLWQTMSAIALPFDAPLPVRPAIQSTNMWSACCNVQPPHANGPQNPWTPEVALGSNSALVSAHRHFRCPSDSRRSNCRAVGRLRATGGLTQRSIIRSPRRRSRVARSGCSGRVRWQF